MLYSYTVICLYISVYGYVGCFHFFAITNKVAMAVWGRGILSVGSILVYFCLKLLFGLKKQ